MTLETRPAFDAPASTRVRNIAELRTMASSVFGDDDAAEIWLRAPNRIFRETAPMDALDTEAGAATVRQVLNAIATGGAA